MNVLNVNLWWKVKSIVDKATSNDENNTSGFIYNEIAQMTFESDSHSTQVLEKLISRLSTNQPIVKKKSLMVIKYCIEKGNPNFKRDLHQKMQDLRNASNFTGPLDVLEGDAPYRRVREEANKVMNLMYDNNNNNNNNPNTKKIQIENMQGINKTEEKIFHNFQDGSNGLNPSSRKIKLESYGNWEPKAQPKTSKI